MIGKTGTGDGEFNYPTELRLNGSGPGGGRRHEFPGAGTRSRRARSAMRSARSETERDGFSGRKGLASIPKVISTWSTDSGTSCRSSTSRAAALLLRREGNGSQDSFNCLAGLQIDKQDRIYVVDSFNRRVQIFHYYGIAPRRTGGSSEKNPVAGLALLMTVLAIFWRMVSARRAATDRRCAGHAQSDGGAVERRFIPRELWVARFCHAPHSGLGGISPLWNQKLSQVRPTRPTPVRPTSNKARRSRRSERPAACA